jgi:DNA (cytosine-5)-methyltransferase 1
MYKTIDLFAGLGGIRKGFELTGKCENVLSAEIDKFACQAYEHLYNENPYNDVTSSEFKEKCKNSNYDILFWSYFTCFYFYT